MRSWKSFERACGYRRIAVKPINGAVGAEISGVRLDDPIDDELAAEIRRAFAENLVIYFRGQHGLTREAHIAYAQLFGTLQKIPHILSVDGYPDVQIVERLKDDTRLVVGEAWHNDSTFLATPPTSVSMHAISVPDFGGDTAFSNMYLAYESLSDGMKTLVRGMRAVHSASKLFGTGTDQSRVMMKKMDPVEGDREVTHPLVCTHPLSGLKYIFANSSYTQRIDGLTDAESAPILEYLYEQTSRIEFTGRVQWENGTVLTWDNRCAYHRAIADYQGKYRYMERVTTGGEIPA